MKISIIIPNYNGEKYLRKCLSSIFMQTYKDYEVIIVDNNSNDKSLETIKKDYDFIKIIENKSNLGFSVAVNQGIKYSCGEFILLINNDIELDSNCIEELYNCIMLDKNIFSVQAKMLQYYDRNKIDDAGDEYTILGWAYKVGEGKNSLHYKNVRQIFSSCAGAAIYRREILNEIGYFDENFFAYLEDVDIGYRARISGYKNVFCPTAICYHVGSATSGSKHNDFKVRISARNNIYVIYKNMPSIQILINLPFLLIGFLIKIIFFYNKGYGKVYIKGLAEGLATVGKLEKIEFKAKNSINYLKIEWLLVVNSLKFLFYNLA